MGLFVMEYSMNKQIEAKQKDMTMLRAMININNRVTFTQNNNTNGTKIPPPIVVNDTRKNNTVYGSCMWLFK
jgi:hypothetical protein